MAQYIVKDKAGLVLLTLESPTQEDIDKALAPYWEKGLKQDDLVCSFAPEDKPKVRKPRADKGQPRKPDVKKPRSRGAYFVVGAVVARCSTKEEVIAVVQECADNDPTGDNPVVIRGREFLLKAQYKLTGV